MKLMSFSNDIISANAFASTFYFFSMHKPPQKKIKRACKPPHPTVQGFVRTLNSEAMNVNRFVEGVCGLQTTQLRGKSSSMPITSA